MRVRRSNSVVNYDAHSWVRSLVCAALSAGVAVAQEGLDAPPLRIGSVAPASALGGALDAHGIAPARAAIVARLPSSSVSARRVLGHLGALASRCSGASSLRIVVVGDVAGLGLSLPRGVFQSWGQAERGNFDRWHVTEFEVEAPSAVLLDESGRLLRVGRILDEDFGALAEAAVAGSFGLEAAHVLEELRIASLIAARTRNWRSAGAVAERVRVVLPWHPGAWRAQRRAGVRFDERAFGSYLAAADAWPRVQARIVVDGLGTDAAVASLPAMARAVELIVAHPHRGRARAEAAFRFHVLRDEVDAASRWVFKWIEAAKGFPAELRGIAAQIEGTASRDAALVEARRTALRLALGAAPRDEAVLEDYFDALCLDEPRDFALAGRIGRRLIDSGDGDPRRLNAFAWRLMTEEPYEGNLAPLALYACNRMRQVENWRTHWRVDTVALAEFTNGHFAAAVELQEEAVAGCDPASRGRYRVRLESYRTALQAAVAPPAPTPSATRR